ncbi:MAG: phosphodiesterase, partial [Spartobacteria bacterium]|nr:phosphodiesterase [Spartobacteria bacterium]
EIDAGLSRLAKRLRDTDTLLLVTADHGLIDAPLAHRVNLAAIPGLYDCLTILPSGDSREVSCFVRPARVAQFLDVVQTHLAEACICIAGEELIASGVYGPGAPHAALAQRIGDYVLISRGNYAFSYPSRGFEAAFNVGNHGGMSATEVQIPLFVISPGDKP